MALGLDSASPLLGLAVWAFISVTNAVLYAIPGAILGLIASRKT
jgi:hypothetical protein